MGLLQRLKVPATESQLAVALVFSAVVMSLLLWAVVWQGNVIAYQRDVIKWMMNARFRG